MAVAAAAVGWLVAVSRDVGLPVAVVAAVAAAAVGQSSCLRLGAARERVAAAAVLELAGVGAVSRLVVVVVAGQL